MTTVPEADAVLRAFGLPGSAVSMTAVEGGWSNDVLRLETTEGDYAVKVVRNPWGEPRWREWLEEGLRLELAAIDAGVAAPPPVLVDAAAAGGAGEPDPPLEPPVPGGSLPSGRAVADVPVPGGSLPSGRAVVDVPVPGGSLPSGRAVVDVPVPGGSAPVRVHRWVPGAAVPREPVDVDLARWVGATVARVHALALRPLRPDLYAGRVGLTTADHWPALVSRARSVGAPWAGALAASEPLARRAGALLRPWDDDAAVLVHGDLDQKNLLVTDDGPVLLDWDVVLPTVPSHDLAHAALTMASWREPSVARAVLDGYAGVAGERPSLSPSDLGPALASRLGWIRFSVDRAMDAGPPYPLDLDALLADLAHRVDVAEHLADWLADT